MPEPRSKFIDKIFVDKAAAADAEKTFTSERQHTAQAFSLHVDFRSGLASEGVAWSHFARYRGADLGEHECLRIVFGPACAMEIVGHNLGKLVAAIREGQLNGVREMTTAESNLAVHEADAEPVILSVTSYPDFDEFFKMIKEEGKDEHEPGFARKVRR